jgi:hypothetical protein
MHELDKQFGAIFLKKPLFENHKNIRIHPGEIFDKLFKRFEEKISSEIFHIKIYQYFKSIECVAQDQKIKSHDEHNPIKKNLSRLN